MTIQTSLYLKYDSTAFKYFQKDTLTIRVLITLVINILKKDNLFHGSFKEKFYYETSNKLLSNICERAQIYLISVFKQYIRYILNVLTKVL